MYPQTVVPLTNPIHKALTDNYENEGKDVYGNQVTQLKDVYYTASIDGNDNWSPTDESTWEKNEVYSYLGDRYVKVTPYARDITDAYYYNDKIANPDLIGQVPSGSEADAGDAGHSLRWFKIEPIKWIILNFNKSILENTSDEMVDNPALLETETYELYAADVLMSGILFGTDNHTSWEGSMINQYLNVDFLSQAFSTDEAKLIQQSTIYNNRALGNGTISSNTLPEFNSSLNHYPEGGQNGTTQKIYLLSRYELSITGSPYVGAGKIFTSDANRQASGTDYARAHNLVLAVSGNNVYSYYWTRTAYSNGTHVHRVDTTGTIGHGTTASHVGHGTRPALQLNEWLY